MISPGLLCIVASIIIAIGVKRYRRLLSSFVTENPVLVPDRTLADRNSFPAHDAAPSVVNNAGGNPDSDGCCLCVSDQFFSLFSYSRRRELQDDGDPSVACSVTGTHAQGDLEQSI